MQVRTIKPHQFYGKNRKFGDKYEIKGDSDLKLAIALGFVKEVSQELPSGGVVSGTKIVGESLNAIEKIKKVSNDEHRVKAISVLTQQKPVVEPVSEPQIPVDTGTVFSVSESIPDTLDRDGYQSLSYTEIGKVESTEDIAEVAVIEDKQLIAENSEPKKYQKKQNQKRAYKRRDLTAEENAE